MRLTLLGGFGEKGRTSVMVDGGGTRILLDAGIKVGASGAGYYPTLEGSARDIDALFVSHAHEDHIGALGWLAAKGFRGRILMSAETCEETPATLAAYADAGDVARFAFPRERIELFEPGQTLSAGGLTIATGRSGHVAGGVWLAVDDGARRAVYCADVVPDSAVFAMDPPPRCDLILLDAAYGADPVPGLARAKAIAHWAARHAQGCLLPTPLSGRSLELIAAIDVPFAIPAAMRAALAAQIEAGAALVPDIAGLLRRRLDAAADWADGEALPSRPLLSHDGMGSAGPSARLLPMARDAAYPVLLTGHLPEGTPAHRMHEAGRADWIRMPTHPTLAGNVGIWQAAGRPMALGHSCGPSDLAALAAHIPALRTDCRTGDRVVVPGGGRA